MPLFELVIKEQGGIELLRIYSGVAWEKYSRENLDAEHLVSFDGKKVRYVHPHEALEQETPGWAVASNGRFTHVVVDSSQGFYVHPIELPFNLSDHENIRRVGVCRYA